jgi:hypothetical protein
MQELEAFKFSDRVQEIIMYIVKLEEGVWLADGEGDPCRTLSEENAKKFEKFSNAKRGLSNARAYKEFASARIFVAKPTREEANCYGLSA